MARIAVYVALLQLLPMAWCLSCGICRDATCPDTSTCTAGTQMDDCGCCTICSKAEGDKCAGRYGRFGYCGVGLTCDQGVPPEGTDPFYHWLRSDGLCVPTTPGKDSETTTTTTTTTQGPDHDFQEQSLQDQT